MRRTVRLNVKHFDSTRYRRGQRLFVMGLHKDGQRGVVEGVIVSEYVNTPLAFRKTYAVRVTRDVLASEVGLFDLKDFQYGDAIR